MIATILSRLRALPSADAGTALVELALVAPMLLMLMLGAIEVGRFADYAIKVTNGARAGAAFGAQNLVTASLPANISAAALADAAGAAGASASSAVFCTCADGSSVDCGLTNPCSTSHRIVYVQVNTTGTLTSLFGSSLLPAALSAITDNGVAIMRVAE